MKQFQIAAVLLFPFVFASCAILPAPPPKMTQLQLRQMQTREYDASRQVVMEAAVAVLHDEGYIIKNADSNLGILRGSKDVDVESGWGKFFSVFDDDGSQVWDKNSVHEISVNVQQFGKVSRVRIISQVKTYNNRGGVSRVYQVKSEDFYRDIFSKVDKGIFLRKENL